MINIERLTTIYEKQIEECIEYVGKHRIINEQYDNIIKRGLMLLQEQERKNVDDRYKNKGW